MLEEVLNHLHNWFRKERRKGAFTVSGGVLDVDIQDGQYFRIIGSVFNDGLHQAPDRYLTDERFTGEVWLLAIPKAVIDVAAEIKAWCAKNSKVLESPFQSESFGGYSYSKSGSTADGADAASWQGHFRKRLNAWRKLP